MCVAKSDVRFIPHSDRESGLPRTVMSMFSECLFFIATMLAFQSIEPVEAATESPPITLQSQREKKSTARIGVQLCFFRQSRSAKICSDLRQLRT